MYLAGSSRTGKCAQVGRKGGSLEDNDLYGGTALCLTFPGYRMLKIPLYSIGVL